MSKQAEAWDAIISEIRRRIEKGARGTHAALARQLGVERGTLTRWMQGTLKGERVPYDKMLFLMERLELDPRRYFGDAPWANLGGVPIIALAACGYDWCTRERLNATAPRPGDHALNRDLFAVLAVGDSMPRPGSSLVLLCIVIRTAGSTLMMWSLWSGTTIPFPSKYTGGWTGRTLSWKLGRRPTEKESNSCTPRGRR